MTYSTRKIRLGNVSCSTHTINQLVTETATLLKDKSLLPRTITFLNAHVYNLAAVDPELPIILNQSRIVAADGMSIVWASRLFGTPMKERCNMTEAFRNFLLSDNIPQNEAVLIGGTQEDADKAAVNATNTSSHCRITRALSGHMNDQDYAEQLPCFADADFIFIGMGTPKSERVLHLASKLCPKAIIWHIGGGTVRFYAGTLKEAPAWMRRSGLQWMHRLALEPRRMWKRYVLGNPLFVWRILTARALQKHNA